MDHRIPTIGAVLAIVAAVAATITFIYLNEAFKGPSVTSLVSHPYELEATFDDVENLPTKTSVLTRGVEVGTVDKVSFDHHTGREPASGTVTFSLDDRYAPIYRDASARIGERTILGDAFLDLDRGNPAAGELSSGDSVKALPSVDFDEAFDFLDKKGRAHLRSTLDTIGEGASTPGNGFRLNGTVGGLARTADQLDRLTTELQGQEANIAGLTSNTASVLGTLGDREQSLREISASGRRTLDALASNTASLEQGVHELPGLLDAGQSSLAGAQPLLREARPLVGELRSIAPDLKPVIAQLGPLSRDSARLIAGLKPFRRAAAPWLRKTRELLIAADPVVKELEPAVRNLVPLLGYLAPRANSVTSFFSNTASSFAHGDSRGRWARFAMEVVPPELAGGAAPGICQPEDDLPGNTGVCENAYPEPNDALDPEPFKPGDFKRLYPWTVPPRP